MGVRVECDWCRQAIPAGTAYVTVQIDGQIVKGHPANDPEDVGGPARVYCGLDRYNDDDPAANGVSIGRDGWGHRTSCAQRMLAALNGNPVGRADMGLEWRLVPQVAPSPDYFIDGAVELLEMSSRALVAIRKAGIDRVHELARLTEAEWRAIPGIKDAGAQEIREALHRHAHINPKKLAALVTDGASS